MTEAGWIPAARAACRKMSGRDAADAGSDEALASRVHATGDADAFAQLVTRYRARLIAFTRRVLSAGIDGTDEAEDVAQEAFVAAYAKRHTFRRGEPFRPWLYRIALNRCLDRLRTQNRRPQMRIWESAEPELAAAAMGPMESVLAREQDVRLQSAVGALPERLRVVFLLRHVDDLSYEEIASVTGQPVGTVKTHLFRARAALRVALADYWRSDGP